MECEHGSDPRSCPVCLGPAPAPVITVGVAFDARFDGTCTGCGLAIHVGQRIRRRLVDDDPSGVCHDGCEP